MIELTLAEIAVIVDGHLSAGASPDAVITGSVEFDSRRVAAGDLFLALSGDRSDGHDFTSAAVAAGAVAALVSRTVAAPNIEVEDGLRAFGALAAFVVRQLPALNVIGVTGSSGKTSTKDLLAQLLAQLGPTVAPPGSFNNELGHPYTVLKADTDTRFLVLETSARAVGHIRYLTEIAPPRIGIVLNVGSAHLGEFGSRAAIAQAKGELVEALPGGDIGGLAVLNADDPVVAAMASRTAARVVTVGRSADADLRAIDVRLDQLGRPRFTITDGGQSADVSMLLTGEHHVGNALAAAAVAREFGMTIADAADALSLARAQSPWRMEVSERVDGVRIINDAYNANPESMRAALTSLTAITQGTRGHRSWAVLGPMAELGSDGPAEHEALGRLVAQLGVSKLVAVGELARPIVTGASQEDSRIDSTWVADTAGALELLHTELGAGDVVLVKASRSAHLEELAIWLSAGVERLGDRP